MRNLFSGEYKHNLDSKGRIIMPVKFREAIGESFVVTRGLDKNLYVYSHEEWDKFCEKLSALPLSSKEARNFSLLFLSGATDCETDKQGRFLIPPTLRDYAGLEKEVTVTGSGNKLAIWSSEKLIERIESIDTDQMADDLYEKGIII